MKAKTALAQQEAEDRARFAAFRPQGEAMLLAAGWTAATCCHKPEPFISQHGPIIKVRGVDKYGTPHSAAFDGEFSIADYLASLTPPAVISSPSEPDDDLTIPEDLTKKLGAFGQVGPGLHDCGVGGEEEGKASGAEVEPVTTEQLIDAMRADADAAEGTIRTLSKEDRRRFTELLNVEKAELRNKRNVGMSDEADEERAKDVDRLLNLFARVGEM